MKESPWRCEGCGYVCREACVDFHSHCGWPPARRPAEGEKTHICKSERVPFVK